MLKKHIPSDYLKVTWDSFVGDQKDTKIIEINKYFTNIIQNKDPVSLSELIKRGMNFSIIGERHSGVSTLGYLILKETALLNFSIQSVRWENFLSHIRSSVNYKSDISWEVAKEEFTYSDVLFIDEIDHSFIHFQDAHLLMNDILSTRTHDKKMTIFGMNFVPTATSFTERFYNLVLHNEKQCLRLFLTEYGILINKYKQQIHNADDSKNIFS